MIKYLVDVNLPKKFSFFNSSEFIHVVDINPFWGDNEIWNYALKNNLIILTKDSDFYFKSIGKRPLPKIIYFKLGNMRLNQLHTYFLNNWEKLNIFISEYFLVIAYADKIQGMIKIEQSDL